MTSILLLIFVLILKIGSVGMESAPPPFPNPKNPALIWIEPAAPSSSCNHNCLPIGGRLLFFDNKHFVQDGWNKKLWVIMVPLAVGFLLILLFVMLIFRVIDQPRRDARVFPEP